MNILNRLGLYTRTQYNALLEQKSSTEQAYNSLIFDFDQLLKNYGSQQLNALYYKMVNLCRNSPDKKYLLDRWAERLSDARKS